jgi:putative hydrolase of the HAD superfamily
MPKIYRHLFFDLDRTLWDFEKSAVEAFEEIFEKYQLKKRGIQDPLTFHKVYSVHNRRLWDMYREGHLGKETLRWKRFYLTLLDFGIDDKLLSEKIGEEYLAISPRKVNLFPHAMETLDCLSKRYHLHLITNGFREVQTVKVSLSGMHRYFEKLITSEEAGVKKPDPRIFYYALEKTGALADESLMIGDDYPVDIEGARNVGMDQVFFDPENRSGENGSTYKIKDLKELCEFL